MICYSVEHDRSGKQYIGIASRDLATRKSEHESHAARGSRTAFHTALRKYGKDSFSWKVLAEGDKEIMQILERILIGLWRTHVPRGFNSTNEAYEHELPPSDHELNFFADLDQFGANADLIYDLRDKLDDAINNRRISQRTKGLMKPLFDHLMNEDPFHDCEDVED